MLILALLRAYLRLAVEPDPDPPADPAAVGDPPSDGDLPDLTDPDPPADDVSATDEDPAVELAREREARQRAEREREEYKTAAERARAAAAPPPGPSDEQKLFDQEEAKLRDPNATEQDRYWINANRTLRANARMAQDALFASRESSDKQDYAQLSAGNPLAKKYADRVEAKLAEVRKGGGNLDRRIVLKMLIGDDIVEGKVKTKPKAAAAEKPKPVDRGHLPNSRSNVRGNGALTDHQKRIQRLEGQNI